MLRFTSLLTLSMLLVPACSSSDSPVYPAALSPAGTVKSFQLIPGFRAEIFAAEPYIADPVEMVMDEQGQVYVVEMPDYPNKPSPDKARSRVRLLEDSDGDGRIDRSTIFAEGLMEASSALPWKGGLIVCAAPDILYLKDTDGDQVADHREVLFTGFFDQNPEIQITNLRYGLDNWIYAGNYGQAGSISSPKYPELPAIEMRGADFRFRLEPFQFEATTGPTQFGHDQDDWGHRLVTQNSLHARHLVISRHYLLQNPLLARQQALHPTYEDGTRMYQLTPPPYWRATRTARRQKKYDEQGMDKIEHAANHFTGCTGTTFYLADAFPTSFYGSVFTGDVAGNLVHRDLFTPLKDSPSFRTKRAATEQDREFLASTDSWFRPANFFVGPDGYLYIVDMYRQHIETPLSIPEDLKADMDFYNGEDKGRIYRILPDEATASRSEQIDLLKGESADLLKLLAHPNRWYRLQAQRLMVENQKKSLAPQLRDMVRNHPLPQARVHALYTLEGIGELDMEIIVLALADSHPGVRENAIKLGEGIEGAMKLFPALSSDPSLHVALQAILSIGTSHPYLNKSHLLAKAAVEKIEDPWFRMAILAGLFNSEEAFSLLNELENRGDFFITPSESKQDFLESISSLIGTGQQSEIRELLTWLKGSTEPGTWQVAVAQGLAKGFSLQGEEFVLDQETSQHIQQLLNEIPQTDPVQEAMKVFL